MKSDTILLLVIMFFVLGCTFSCDGMKEFFTNQKRTATWSGCRSCMNNKILNNATHKSALCAIPDSNPGAGIAYVRSKGCNTQCNLAWNQAQIRAGTNHVNRRLGSCKR